MGLFNSLWRSYEHDQVVKELRANRPVPPAPQRASMVDIELRHWAQTMEARVNALQELSLQQQEKINELKSMLQWHERKGRH